MRHALKQHLEGNSYSKHVLKWRKIKIKGLRLHSKKLRTANQTQLSGKTTGKVEINEIASKQYRKLYCFFRKQRAKSWLFITVSELNVLRITGQERERKHTVSDVRGEVGPLTPDTERRWKHVVHMWWTKSLKKQLAEMDTKSNIKLECFACMDDVEFIIKLIPQRYSRPR